MLPAILNFLSASMLTPFHRMTTLSALENKDSNKQKFRLFNANLPPCSDFSAIFGNANAVDVSRVSVYVRFAQLAGKRVENNHGVPCHREEKAFIRRVAHVPDGIRYACVLVAFGLEIRIVAYDSLIPQIDCFHLFLATSFP